MGISSAHDQLEELAGAVGRIASADSDVLSELKTELLGRKAGRLTHLLRSLKDLPTDERRQIGARANEIKEQLETAFAARERELQSAEREDSLGDLSMPSRERWRGAKHPVTIVVDEICDIFRELGFTRIVGNEAELEEYNFTKLNIPLDHPAADMQDSFYLNPGVVLRTHTSPMQAHTLEQHEPPIRIVVPGQVYRRDPFDPSHSPVFEQVEGLAVDEGITFVDFKASIDFFCKRFFSADTPVRFRPSFFPFTEPSAEVDVGCPLCKGSGCSTCKRTGWMEIMGAGMVDPAVFEENGVDSEKYTGWAFGMGPHRIAMVRYGVRDIRSFYHSDMRFLDQFRD